MDMKLDDEALKVIITKSIMDSLTPEKRELLISNAIKELLAKNENNRYDSRSRFQTIFDDSVHLVAREVVFEMVKDNIDIKNGVTKLFTDAWNKLTVDPDHYGKFVDKVAGAMKEALSSSR
jgi:hypothetical protein